MKWARLDVAAHKLHHLYVSSVKYRVKHHGGKMYQAFNSGSLEGSHLLNVLIIYPHLLLDSCIIAISMGFMVTAALGGKEDN